MKTHNPVHLPLDIDADQVVGIQISPEGTKLWVCVDGECVLRVRNQVVVELDDQRQQNDYGTLAPWDDGGPIDSQPQYTGEKGSELGPGKG